MLDMKTTPEMLATTGSIRDLFATREWSDTALGPRELWAPSLEVSVSMMLDSLLPMWICWGPEMLLIYNDSYIDILGNKHPESMLKPYAEVWPEVWEYLAPITIEAFAGRSTFLKDTELLLRRTERDEKAWFTYSITPLRNAGSVAGFIGTAIETTSHVISQRQKVSDAERLEQMFDQAPGFMAVLEGPSHKIVIANKMYMQVVGHRHVLGKTFREALPDAVEQGYLTMIDKVYASGVAHHAQVVNYAVQPIPNGPIELRVVDFILQPITDSYSNVTGIFIQGNDVTEQTQAREQIIHVNAELSSIVNQQMVTQRELAEADARKDEFLAMLSHELRNPLAPIRAAADLLQIASSDERRVRQASQIISRQVSHMTELVDDLLDVSRVTRGEVALDCMPIEISEIITEAVEQVAPLIRTRHHEIGLQLSPELVYMSGDRKRLVQVIVNILSNAAKYTNNGGRLLVRTAVVESFVQLDIIDNGIGMSKVLIDRAFDLFAQAERSSDRTSGGLGLGLALVKSLVNLHKGTVTCESDGPGKGSKFSVRLPRIPSPDGANTRQPDAIPAQQAASSLRIMVVDDNVDAASTMAMLLETSGHQVSVAHNAFQALMRVESEKPQVCLLDIGLPDMDGNELARRLRGESGTASSVLIAVTGYGQAEDRRQTLAAGFDHHLVKPLEITVLNEILSRVADAH